MNGLGKPVLALDEKDGFELWLEERPKWLQTAAHKIIEMKRLPNADEINELAKLCMVEAQGNNDENFAKVTTGSLALASARPAVKINSIKNVLGVAALRQGAALEFGSHSLTVVYGTNGAGKSGFARLLKNICGSSSKEEKLHSNIFEDESPVCSASLQVVVGDQAQEFDWTADKGVVSALRSVHIFDSKAAAMYVSEKTEATYEPTQMRFVSSLIKVCDAVAAAINAEKAKLLRRLPTMPELFDKTASFTWLAKISAHTTPELVENVCQLTEIQLQERLSLEAALAQKDIAGRLVIIQKEKASLNQCKVYLSGVKAKLSDALIQLVIECRLQVQAKRHAANEDVKRVFADSIVDGIGNESWKNLWEQAKKFSTMYAYPGTEFPNVAADAKCVLCNQGLDLRAQNRLKQFEEFVKSGLEADAKAWEQKLKQKITELPAIPSAEDWLLQLAVLKLPSDTCIAVRDAIVKRKGAAENAMTLDEISYVDWMLVEAPLEQLLSQLATEEKALREMQETEKRKETVSRVNELKAIEWLRDNKQSIVNEVQRLKEFAKLENALSYTSTVSLTRKNNELAKSDLSAAYQARFKNELRELGGSQLRVEAQSKQEGKGKITFVIALKDAKRKAVAEQILSEGEFRIVALAAFLADITGADQSTPFVFDDPISSLDQDFEERVVRRLVGLAKTRQVIVFTHRLSLLAQIEGEVKKIKDAAKIAGESPIVQLHIETLRRMGNVAGVRVPFNVRDSKPEKAINVFKGEYIPKLKKMIGDFDGGYDHYAKGVCSDFRILVEKCVESTLLNDVVTRFKRPINTMGKLIELAKIVKSDCEFIDDLMTRYSVFEHSQSDEFPAPVPNVEQLETDVENLAKWLTEFTKRAVPA
jgi:energy-coupling factor transporter ATP-binding protein EcfA2